MPEGIFEKAFTKRQNRRHDRWDSLLIKDHAIQDNEISRKQERSVDVRLFKNFSERKSINGKIKIQTFHL